jgi:hypothetical protein
LNQQVSNDSLGKRVPAPPSTHPTVNPIAPVSTPAEPSQKTIEAHEKCLYEQIAQELETNTVDKGLWTMDGWPAPLTSRCPQFRCGWTIWLAVILP